MPLITLPRLQRGVPIVDNTGKPTAAFVRYWNLDFIGALERSLNDLAAVQATLVEQQATLEEQQDLLAAQVVQIQAILGLVQATAQAANNAQSTADGGAATSGSASGTVPGGTGGWQQGPQVDLTAAVVGDLQITGSGPQQDGSTSTPTAITGEWRIVEIDGMTETTVFTGYYGIYPGSPATVINESAAAVAAFNLARTNSGAISYRIDTQRTDGGTDIDITLGLYIFARRAA